MSAIAPPARIAVWTHVGERPVMEALAGTPGIDAVACASREDFMEALGEAHGAVMVGSFACYTAEVARRLEAAPNLSWLQLVSAGYEGVEAAGLAPHIQLTGPGEGISASVAEHAIALLWAIARGLPQSFVQQSERRWDRGVTAQMSVLRGRTLVLLGLGAIGGRIAALARAIGMRVVGVTRSGAPHAAVDESLPLASLDEALGRADAVILSLPSSPSTRGLMDARRIGLLRPHVLLVNVGRGELIDQPALIAALEDGRLGGAALDVADPEPPHAEDPVWTAPRLLITPHVAGAGDPAAMACIARAVAENAHRFAVGEPLLNRIRLA